MQTPKKPRQSLSQSDSGHLKGPWAEVPGPGVRPDVTHTSGSARKRQRRVAWERKLQEEAEKKEQAWAEG